MPFINNEFVSEKENGTDFQYSPLNAGQQIIQILERNLAQHGDRNWLTDVTTGKSKTYSDLKTQMCQVASSLWKRGFSINDRVLLVADNHVEFPIMFYGSWVAGGANITLTLNLLKEDIRERAEETTPKFVLVDELRAAKVVEALSGLECVCEIFVIGQAEGCTPFYQLLEDDGKGLPEEMNIDTDSIAWIMYSSGTTGKPKGMIHTHRTLNCLFNTDAAKMFSGVKFVYINLMINSGGMSLTTIMTLGHGELNVITKASDEALLEAIDKIKPLAVGCFPSQIAWLCKHEELHKYDMSSIKILFTTGSAINAIYEKEIFNKIPNMYFLNVTYASSETLVVATNSPKPSQLVGLDRNGIIAKHIVGCAGKLQQYVKIKILDRDAGANLGYGQIGEICVKSPYVMKGYIDRPKETAEAILDGWYHTGDKGYFDENDNLYIVGRYKELIKYRMAHVVPSNIEKHIMTHTSVEDAGVVGLPHEVDGELPLAFVVVKDGCSVSEEEIVDYISGRVVNEERLRGGVRFIDKIPRNELGKIVRPLLTQLLQDN